MTGEHTTIQRVILFVALTLLGVGIALGDLATGRDVSLTHFYLVPITVGAWYAGRTIGIVLVVLSAIECFFVAQIRTSDPYLGAIYWNTITRLVIYLPLAVITARLREALTHEKTLARTDSLTGAANTRTFHEQAELEVQRSTRTSRPLSIAYIDLDNFKYVNDQFGHLVGDEVLRIIVRTMRRNTRATDIVARLGGDEFALLLPETDADGTLTSLRKLQAGVQTEMRRRNWPVTTSIGAVTFRTPPANVATLIQRADKRLYDAKENGKNRIEHEVVEETS